MIIKENISLAPLTTFHIGGPARYFVAVKNLDELKESLAFAKAKKIRVLVLGGGSNVLIPDKGFDGLVIKIEIGGVELQKNSQKTLLIAGAGESWDVLVQKSVAENLWGIENLSGIPGTAGGAVAGNIGAYGQALSQTLLWTEVFDTVSGEIKKINNAECAFDYRDSFFKHDEGQYVILRVAFTLSTTPAPELSYTDLRERFSGVSTDIMPIREAILTIREGKFPDIRFEGTAGSFFKNPIVSKAEAGALKERYPGISVFEMPETSGIKIPLAWLLDKILNLRGLTIGRARLFEKQPLVIVAEKNCTAGDVQKLSEEVEKQVKEKIGITIEREVQII
ncbi:MAG: UDP-N-acetylmuramate dehydrogenase [bacterium]|nr:UDP-N-acetylmuramate dehydrogenase [bacterium]